MNGEVTLPWPQKALSPNSRCHWSVKAKSAKAYRYECFVLAKQAKVKVDWEGPVHLYLTFRPPDKRHRDVDNCVASMKAGLDGLADALKIDDSRFRLYPLLSGVTGGNVYVTIAKT